MNLFIKKGLQNIPDVSTYVDPTRVRPIHHVELSVTPNKEEKKNKKLNENKIAIPRRA